MRSVSSPSSRPPCKRRRCACAPGHARYDPRTGEQIAENKGVAPDVEVDARPDLLAKGEDPQLEKGVAMLLAELERNPRRLAEPKLPPARASQKVPGN